MVAITKLLAGGAALAALASAAPAAAQYYPGYGYGYGYGSPYGGNVVGQVVNDVLGGGYGYGGYGPNSQIVVNQCATAAQMRLNGGYNTYGYAGGSVGARVLGISHVDPHPDGGITVRGVASTGRYAAYGYGGYGAHPPVDLTWGCRTDARGFIRELTVSAAQYNYGNNGGYGSSYTPWDYSQYGYRRY